MSTEYAKALGVRSQQGLSLHGVEQKSQGRWKAVVVGSYERGDRAVTVQRLSELAEFYGVPVHELLPGTGSPGSAAEPGGKLVLDLERLKQIPVDKAGPLVRYVGSIQSQRGDWNGRVMTIRAEDVRTLSVIYDLSPTQLIDQLTEWEVLNPDAARPFMDELEGQGSDDEFSAEFSEDSES
jgi:transcriptional regulator with XRE-family HTH domain